MVNPSMGRAFEDEFSKNCTIFAEPFQWQMLDQTQMAANPYCSQKSPLVILKVAWSAVAGLEAKRNLYDRRRNSFT